ncbi:LysR family transcriptional regulator [Vibrio brasiliensis]|mgnify:CR=1 FL=1|uniref:Putative DNA-binding transcriptional regulator n=1 Tax=Vibrio brasiliensis LMG 20546 TaxID=945543 RepID=E8LTV9_9VIBR|nr:DNA-binding transcriptional activator PunR [Vibrio brasiliensis]EGA65879.1 putative DNA-binding transcriptional regulator [Vibrio brasiliensis LMG 20546]MCG9650934.1 LysR family transcriptional regulator [Vibrio brasiliensis]MCG9728145.1 LysR family transcriptional regulator [Vibrio brasiliensis]MCG9752476.1 LysR family transcriptional regulator [Vibrio brasiliensis]MCG9785478.1 LysR family transcriptional regulator [Vibrio brasiliensis]|tara:strand:+ start:184 stop:1086 length:903 start_codon:yes stop_codon:yes gene_type:complete
MYSKSSLEMLDTVARLGSFTAAAEVLHKVPSAISYGVRQVEQELDVVLFRRLPRKVELTPAGELFIAEARMLLRQMAEIQSQTRRVAHGWQSTLKLTLDNVVKLDKLKPLVESFYQEFEFAELQINMEVFNGSWEAIAQERADIVIGATSAIPVGGDFEVRDMGVLDWAFVMSPAHPCVREQYLSEEFVSQFPAICLDDTSSVLPKRHTGHYPKQRRLLLPNWYSAIECLKNGVGVGYMPRHIAMPLIHDGVLVEKTLPDEKPLSQCCLVWRKDDNHKLIQWMIDYLGSSNQLHQDWLKY